MKLFWFIPTQGDGRYLASSNQMRQTDHGYLKQIAQAVDHLGFEGVLLPTGNSCEDAWVVASTLVPVTKRLKFLVALRPGVMSPSVSARMAATFDRFSDGRLLINVVTGGDPEEAKGDGQSGDLQGPAHQRGRHENHLSAGAAAPSRAVLWRIFAGGH